MELTTVLFDVADGVATITLEPARRPQRRDLRDGAGAHPLLRDGRRRSRGRAASCSPARGRDSAPATTWPRRGATRAWRRPSPSSRARTRRSRRSSPRCSRPTRRRSRRSTAPRSASGWTWRSSATCGSRPSTRKFAQLFVKLGLMCDVTGLWLLPQIVGRARATELLLDRRDDRRHRSRAHRTGEPGRRRRRPPAGRVRDRAQHRGQPPARGPRHQAGASPRGGTHLRRASRARALRRAQPVEALHHRRSSRSGRRHSSNGVEPRFTGQ